MNIKSPPINTIVPIRRSGLVYISDGASGIGVWDKHAVGHDKAANEHAMGKGHGQ